MARDDEIEDLIAEERSRGRTRSRRDAEALRTRRQLLADLRHLLENRDKDGWARAVEAFGYRRGTKEFREMMELWDDVS